MKIEIEKIECFKDLSTYRERQREATLFYIMLHTTPALSPKEQQRHLRYSSGMLTFYQNYLLTRNTLNVTGGKPNGVWSQSISGVNGINPLVAFYGIHGRQRQVLFFYFVPAITRNMTRQVILCYYCNILHLIVIRICIQQSSIARWPAGLVVSGPDYETRGPGFKSR
jgi:hypothetical protein